MNEVSIIINGVRYDAVVSTDHFGIDCAFYDNYGCARCIFFMQPCRSLLGKYKIFKKSNKSFEK